MTTSPAVAPRAKKRIFYLDFVRALSTLLIVLTHFNYPYLADGRYLLTLRPFGVFVGDLGVSLFLIISGAALTYTYRYPFDLRRFYCKRFTGIYPMFWLAWILGTAFFVIDMHGTPLNAAPAHSLIWTLFGVDGLASVFHIRTAYLLGEWFLGFILLFYLVFPLLVWLVEKFPIPTAVGILVLAGATWVFMRGVSSVPGSVILTMRLPELAFGMYIMRYVKRVPTAVGLGGSAVLLICAFLPWSLPKDIATAIVGMAAFLMLVVIARYVAIAPVRAGVGFISTYSYPIFLVHHVVITKLYLMIPSEGLEPIQLCALFASACVVIILLAVALDRLTRCVIAFTSEAFKEQWWRLTSTKEAP